MRIGLFGGSFDPVHIGHYQLVKDFITKLSLDKVFVIPVFISPFKVSRPPIASPNDRVAMLRLAFESESLVEVLTDEVERENISYTIDTIRKITLKFPQDEIFLLLSEEIRASFSLWKNFEEIKKSVQIEFSQVCIPISSTAVRDNLKKGAHCKEYLLPKVLDYIEKHGLYSS